MTEEKELTPAERMEWLRSRGIAIETPEERKAKAIRSIMNEADDKDDPIMLDEDVGGRSGTRTRRNPYTANDNEDEEKNPSRQQQQRRGGIDASTQGRIKQEDGYSWTQTEEDLEVTIPLPTITTTTTTTPGVVSAKDIKVTFQPRHVLVRWCHDLVGGSQSLLDLSLFEEIDLDGSTWTVESKGQTSKVVLVMEKVEQALWSRINNN